MLLHPNPMLLHSKRRDLVPVLILFFRIILIVTPASAAAAWYNPSWSYRQNIPVNFAKVGSTLTNFPVIFAITTLLVSGIALGNAFFTTIMLYGVSSFHLALLMVVISVFLYCLLWGIL